MIRSQIVALQFLRKDFKDVLRALVLAQGYGLNDSEKTLKFNIKAIL